MSTRPYKPSSRWEIDYLSKSETQAIVAEILASGRYTRHSLAAQLGITPSNITHYLAGRARAPKRIKRLLPRVQRTIVKHPEALKLLDSWLAERPQVKEDSELDELKRELDSFRTHRKLFKHDDLS